MTSAAVPSTAASRAKHKMRSDRAELDALLDAVHIAHVAMVADGHPVALPTAIARDGDRVLLHGSTGSRWMRLLADGADVSIAVTAYDGLVVARSAFESSMLYRSAVLFGRCTPLAGGEAAQAVDVLTEALLPGRTAELRRPTARELAATLVLAMPIGQWSLKVSQKWPDDPPEDVAGDSWAGIVPLAPVYGEPQPAPDLRGGIAVPPSVTALRRAVAGRQNAEA